MAIDFPSSPTNGQVFTDGDKTWVYSSSLPGWQLQATTVVGPTGPTGRSGGPTGPTGPTGPGARENILINGNFNIWQRGTSTTTNQAYTADRWFMNNNGTATVTASQIDLKTDGLGSRYGMRIARSSGTDICMIITIVEGAMQFVGQTVTLSMYLKKGSSMTDDVDVAFGTRASKFGTIYDQGEFTISNSSISSSVWTRFSSSLAVTSATSTNNANLFEIEIYFNMAGGSNVHLDIADVQLEWGTSATAFQVEDPSITLLRCKRYYQECAIQVGTSTTYSTFVYPVEMRINPVVGGGSTGFTVDGASTTVGNYYQTARAKRTITQDADF